MQTIALRTRLPACPARSCGRNGPSFGVAEVGVERPLTVTEEDIDSLREALGLLTPVPVVVVIGGATALDSLPEPDGEGDAQRPTVRETIERIFGESLRPAVSDAGAVVLTGGTDAGVMRMAGHLLADAAHALVGVAPRLMVTGDHAEALLDTNHTAAVLTSGTRWGAETEFLFRLAELLTGGAAPGVVVLANGGNVSFEEARRFLRGGWPILTVSGSGGAAADLISKVQGAQHDSQWGDLHQADVEELARDSTQARRQLTWRLHDDELLKSAWVTFAAYDLKANALKTASLRSRWLLTGLSSLLLVAITATIQFATLGWTGPDGDVAPEERSAWLGSVLPPVLMVSKWLVLSLPLGIAVAAALGNFSGSQVKWRAVRASAETLKREIYRYRSRQGAQEVDAARRLAAVLHVVDDEAIRADIGLAETPPGLIRGRPAQVDLDELEPLSARIYLKRRLEQQVLWFATAAGRRRRREWLIVLAGAVAASTAMALVTTRFAAWVAVLVLASTAFALSRERGTTRQEVAGFDRAIADVNDAWVAWIRLTAQERGQPALLARLVDAVESAFERESLSWSEVMRSAAQRATSSHVVGVGG